MHFRHRQTDTDIVAYNQLPNLIYVMFLHVTRVLKSAAPRRRRRHFLVGCRLGTAPVVSWSSTDAYS